MPDHWPRLTETLPGPNRPGACRACGLDDDVKLALWREHDQQDRPENRFLWLCARCSGDLVEPHVRLYDQLHRWHPAPGAMEICGACVRREGCRCAHPDAKINGGAGLKLSVGQHSIAMVDGVRNGRRCGWREILFFSPVSACTGRTVA